MILEELAEDLRQRRPPVVVVWHTSCRECADGLGGEILANATLNAVLRDYRQLSAHGLPEGHVLLVRADRVQRGTRAPVAPLDAAR